MSHELSSNVTVFRQIADFFFYFFLYFSNNQKKKCELYNHDQLSDMIKISSTFLSPYKSMKKVEAFHLLT